MSPEPNTNPSGCHRPVSPPFRRVLCGAFLGLCCVTVFAAVAGADSSSSGPSLADMTLEQLMNESVTSVSKKQTRLSESSAAIYVITQEDLRRSGAVNIPEALRMVPGLDVARVDANKWAISSRGFNSLYANKLLVLMDGRSVYTPLFAGVHWDAQDTMMEDIDRIEVIRGPGASLWGANAVNGVININTKSARDTQGALITGGAGSEELGFGGIRYGGKIDETAYYRVYAKYFNRDNSVDAAGRDASDEWDMFRTGFRVDWDATTENSLTFQGDYNTGHVGGNFPPNQLDLSQSVVEELDLTGANLLGRWKHTFSTSSVLEIQTYFDHVDRHSPYSAERIDTFDVDGQHRFPLGERQDVIWGLGYRLIADHDLSAGFASFDPNSATRQIASAFVQDEIAIVPEGLRLTLGSKFEHNNYTGFELQPNARLLLTPNDHHSLWASVSRAVRTPARYERDIHFTIGSSPGGGGVPPTQINLLGNPQFQSEKLLAYELGYRVQPAARLAIDLTGFYNVYDDLSTAETGAPSFVLNPPPPHVSVPLQLANQMRGETYGAELAANWNVTDNWKLAGGYTWLGTQLHLDPTSNSFTSKDAEGDSPQHQFHVRSYLDLPYNLQLDAAAYYVDSLSHQHVPAYVRLDLRLGWHPTRNLDLSIGLQNLIEERHYEFGTSTGAQSTQIERSVYGRVTWRF
jgi:iron complex outermembrane recepter protein